MEKTKKLFYDTLFLQTNESTRKHDASNCAFIGKELALNFARWLGENGYQYSNYFNFKKLVWFGFIPKYVYKSIDDKLFDEFLIQYKANETE